MDKVFGIDLGTTYSCIALVDEFGKPIVLQNFDNERTTPSVIFFEDDGNVQVGKVAKEMLKIDPDNVASFIKRSMGDPNYVFIHDGKNYKPEELSGFILKKLVEDASEKVGEEIKDVVITCPAYFGINEREATKVAGEIAGLNVLSIINEPTAAALTYGVDKEDQVILVYDLGGGTFDITMIDVKSDSIDIVVTGGNHELGGKNWDNALMAYLAECFKEETGVEDDIYADSETFGDLQISTEEAKKMLSQREKTKVRVSYGTDRAVVEITQEKFNELTSSLLEQTISLTKETLNDATKKGYNSVDKLLLVGGSTRMPQIKERLEKEFPSIPIESFDPDESVAKGAAIYGQQLSVNGELIKRLAEKLGKDESEVILEDLTQETITEVEEEIAESSGYTLGGVQKLRAKKITDVLSKSFGIRANVGENEIKIVNMLFKQNSVPSEISQDFFTQEDNQQSVEIAIFENELSDDKVEESLSSEIGKGVIEGLPENLPANSPIEVTFSINKEGRLSIKAIEKTGNNELIIPIETSSVISGEELEIAKERSKGIKIS